MSKKRKISEDLSSESVVIDDLRTLLEYFNSDEENAVLFGLNSFKKQILDEDGNDDNSILQQYIRSSPEIRELITIFENIISTERSKGKDASILLDIFSIILQKNRNPKNKYTNSFLSKYIIKKRMNTLFSYIGSDNYPLINAALRLLISINRLGSIQARDVFTHFNFGYKVCYLTLFLIH